jgi:integrase/recombinase XerD
VAHAPASPDVHPASEPELPRPEKRLPRHILTIAEVEQVINTCDTTEPTGLGLRDRAMLETLYSTGMRRGELVALHIDDMDLPRGTVLIRQGKGKKDRVVPIGERAVAWVQRYLYEVRERYVELPDEGALFLAKHGEAMQGKQLSVIVKLAIERANLERFQTTHPNAACHLFRHACATHMLEAGADIRSGAARPRGPEHHRGLYAGEHRQAQGRAHGDPSGAPTGPPRRERRRGGRGPSADRRSAAAGPGG